MRGSDLSHFFFIMFGQLILQLTHSSIAAEILNFEEFSLPVPECRTFLTEIQYIIQNYWHVTEPLWRVYELGRDGKP